MRPRGFEQAAHLGRKRLQMFRHDLGLMHVEMQHAVQSGGIDEEELRALLLQQFLRGGDVLVVVQMPVRDMERHAGFGQDVPEVFHGGQAVRRENVLLLAIVEERKPGVRHAVEVEISREVLVTRYPHAHAVADAVVVEDDRRMQEGMQKTENAERGLRIFRTVEEAEMAVFRGRFAGQDRRDARRGVAELRADGKPDGKFIHHELVALDDFIPERIAEHENLDTVFQSKIS